VSETPVRSVPTIGRFLRLKEKTELSRPPSPSIDEDQQARGLYAHAVCAPAQDPLKLTGELTIRDVDELRRLFTSVLNRNSKLVVDFSEVEDCDAAALQLICSLQKTAVRDGLRLEYAPLSPAIEAAAAALGLALKDLTAVADSPPKGIGSGV
jgi:anti-anti-sigma regulatory factor